jgi:hypothetical protein
MQELTMQEVEIVTGGEAGVPHSNYYYGTTGTSLGEYISKLDPSNLFK